MKKILCIFVFIVFTSRCFAQSNLIKLPLKNEQFTLSAKRVKYDSNNGIIEAFSNVFLSSSTYKIHADYARYEKRYKRVYLKGNVSARWDSNIIKGREVLVYITNSTGWIKGGEIFYSIPHLYFRGDKIDKTGNNTFSFENMEVTGCDTKVPDWSFFIKRGNISSNGEAYLHHVKFMVKRRSIMYLPYMQLPVLVKRKSGFLVPEYISSSTKGTGLILPYYLVISREQDMTLYPGFLSKRGVISGIEYRFVPNIETKGFFMLNYLHDRITYASEKNAPFSLSTDGLIRPNKNRYWIRGKLNSYLFEPDIKLKLDIDYVSDQDFLREFDAGYLGFERSRDIFLDVFGRDIKNKDSLIRQNALLIERTYGGGNIYLKAEYLENLMYKNGNLDPSKDATPERIPEMGFNVYKTPLLKGVFDFESTGSITYFSRRHLTYGTRVDLYPSFSKTFSLNYATIIPKVSFRNTSYILQQRDKDRMDSFENRFLAEFDLNVHTQLYRIYHIGDKGTSIRHIISPEVEYFYRSVKTRDDIPVFDSIDTITREQKIRYSLNNHFTLKRYEMGRPIYRDILQLKFYQTYDIKEARRERDLKKYPKRPFTDIRTEYVFTPSSRFSLKGNVWFSPYIKGITESEQRVEFVPFDFFSGFISHDYTRKITDDIHRPNQAKMSILGYGLTFLSDNKWELSYEDSRDLEAGDVVRQRLLVKYKHQCWSVLTEFSHTQDEDKIMVTITLGSLGEVSQNFKLQ